MREQKLRIEREKCPNNFNRRQASTKQVAMTRRACSHTVRQWTFRKMPHKVTTNSLRTDVTWGGFSKCRNILWTDACVILNDEVTRRTTHSIKLPITWKQIKIRLESCGYTCTEVYLTQGWHEMLCNLGFVKEKFFFCLITSWALHCELGTIAFEDIIL